MPTSSARRFNTSTILFRMVECLPLSSEGVGWQDGLSRNHLGLMNGTKPKSASMNNYDYPPGADTSEAPWNQPEPVLVENDVEVRQCLKKRYVIETDLELEDGVLESEWKNYNYTLTDLLKKLRELATAEKERTCTRKVEMCRIIEACSGWEEEFTEVDVL